MTWIFPPAGLALIWLSRRVSRREQLLGTLGTPLFGIVYLTAIVWGLHFAGIQVYEWRGGYVPVLTLHPTHPNYDRLEADRAKPHTVSVKTPSGRSSYWTGVRGPVGDGVYREMPIATNWLSTGPELLWRQPVGGGYAGFVVARGRAFTVEQRRSQEVATAYDLQTGLELWSHGWDAEFKEPLGGDGPRATPAWDNGRVYVLGALGELRCLDADTGSLHWRHDIVAENGGSVPIYGVSASPLIVDDQVVVLAGGDRGRSVVAYDKISGRKSWSCLDDPQAYVTPMLVELAGQRQMLVVSAKRVLGLAIQNGTLLREYDWTERHMNRNVAQPVVWKGSRIFLSAGYNTACEAAEITRKGDSFAARRVWEAKTLKNKFNTSVYHDGFLYGLDEGMLACVDAGTGERRWKDGRYGYGQLVIGSGVLVIVCSDGDIALVRASPERQIELGRFHGISGKTWNYPAVAEGLLLLRNSVEMACFQIGASASSSRNQVAQ